MVKGTKSTPVFDLSVTRNLPLSLLHMIILIFNFNGINQSVTSIKQIKPHDRELFYRIMNGCAAFNPGGRALVKNGKDKPMDRVLKAIHINCF